MSRPTNPWLVTIAVTVGTLMGALDTSVVNVALPYMRANLGASITEISWISTGYIIALVIIMPLTAWLGAMFGRKRVYMSCLALFTVASFFCGSARSLTTLLLCSLSQAFIALGRAFVSLNSSADEKQPFDQVRIGQRAMQRDYATGGMAEEVRGRNRQGIKQTKEIATQVGEDPGPLGRVRLPMPA